MSFTIHLFTPYFFDKPSTVLILPWIFMYSLQTRPMSIYKYIHRCHSWVVTPKNFRPELVISELGTLGLIIITLKSYKLHLSSFVKGKIIWQRQSSSNGSLFMQNGCIRKLWQSSCPVYWDSRCVSLWMNVVNNLLKSDTIVSDMVLFS